MQRNSYSHSSRFRRQIKKLFLLVALSLSSAAFVHKSVAVSDPTRPSGYAAQSDEAENSSEALRLESVLIGRDRRVAVINGKSCRVGDNINGARLVAIHADGVELLRDGSRVVLPLLKVKVRKYAQ